MLLHYDGKRRKKSNVSERKISFPEARKFFEGVTGKPSYASVVVEQVV